MGTLRSLCSAKMGWRGEIELRDAENGHACAKRSHHVSVTSKTRASASPLDRVAALYSRVSRSMACGDGCEARRRLRGRARDAFVAPDGRVGHLARGNRWSGDHS